MIIKEALNQYFKLSMDEKVELINSIGDMSEEEYVEYYYKFCIENRELVRTGSLPEEEAKMLQDTVIARRIAALFEVSVDAAFYILEMKKTGTVSEEETKLIEDICEKSPVFQCYFHDIDILDEAEEKNGTLSLSDENGNRMDFEFIDLIEYDGNEYAVLLPADDEGSGEVVILQVEKEKDGETYSSVEDSETVSAIFDIFKEKFKDVFQFS